MSRSVVLVSLLLFLVFTSQFEWDQHVVNEAEARPLEQGDVSRRNKDYVVLQREESVKEKIILSQEKEIQKLKTLVQSLEEQLLVCRGKDEFVNDKSSGSLTELINELNHQQIME